MQIRYMNKVNQNSQSGGHMSDMILPLGLFVLNQKYKEDNNIEKIYTKDIYDEDKFNLFFQKQNKSIANTRKKKQTKKRKTKKITIKI